ncbi:hypothetical protein FRC11_007424 [Ceratobasidium sp. 423]|nr:hypothetical protein FRC11_007424 [Ceratobasidium sp. 423]
MSAAAMVGVDVDGHGNDSKTEAPKPVETPKTTFEFSFPLPEHMKANSQLVSTQPETTHSTSQTEPTKPEPQPQPRPRPNPSDPSNPRRRSLLERLTARITTPVPDTTIEDVTWNSMSSDWTDAEDTRQFRPGPVIDFDLAPEEPLVDMEQFGLVDGSWSPVRQSATFPPMASTPKTVFPTSRSAPLSPTRDGARSPTHADPLLPQEPISPTGRARTLSKLSMTGRKVLSFGGRPSARATFSNASKASRRSRRRAHGRGMSGDSIPTRMREGGRLESLTRRGSADALSAEGAMEGTVLYGVGEEMLRLMFGAGPPSSTEGSEKDQLLPQTPHAHVTSQNLMPQIDQRERERTRSLPRPRGSLVSVPEAEKNTDLGSVSYPSVMPLNVRRKGHRRGTGSKENASLDKTRVSLDLNRLSVEYKVRPSLESKVRPSLDQSRPTKSRSRSKSAPLGVSQRKSVEVVGILTNGNNSGRTTPNTPGKGAGRVVIVNSATTNRMGTPTRKTTRSNPLPPSDTETSQTLVQPGVIVTAPTPPAPQRSLSLPIEALPTEGSETGPESPRGTVSRGTSVQFVPESFEGRRRGGRSRKDSANTVPPVPEDRLPMQGWCFLVGFFIPFVWWYASFVRAERGYYGGGIWSRDVESQWEGVRTDVHRDDGRIDAHAWRFRCRLMSAVSIVVYVPVIVLAAVFA